MSEQEHYAAITPPWFEAFEKEAGYMPEQKDNREEIRKLQLLQFQVVRAHVEGEITGEENVLYVNYITDQILALIEEAKKQGEDRVLGMMTDCFGGNKLILARDLETLKETQ